MIKTIVAVIVGLAAYEMVISPMLQKKDAFEENY